MYRQSRNNKTRRARQPKTNKLSKRVRNRKQDNLYSQLNRTHVPRYLYANCPFPPHYNIDLVLVEPNYVLNGSGNPFALREWKINSAYDPDPGVPAGSVAGFTQMAAIYQIYKVNAISLYATLTSNEPSIPLQATIIFRDEQPSVLVTSYSAAQDAMEVSPCLRAKSLGVTTGMSRVSFRPIIKLPLGTICGRMLNYMADNDYLADVNLNPSQIMWMALVVTSPTSSIVIANGVIMNFKIILHTTFSSVRQLYTSIKKHVENSDDHRVIETETLYASLKTIIDTCPSNEKTALSELAVKIMKLAVKDTVNQNN